MPIVLQCVVCGQEFSDKHVGRPSSTCSRACWLKNYEIQGAKRLADRFWSKVDKSAGPDACWPWMAGRDKPYGYGIFRLGSKHLGTRRGIHASRMALQLATGEVLPEHLNACHECDNPPCCNPKHLFVGTQLQNVRDMMEKGRRVQREMRGIQMPMAKLDENKVREIRRIRAELGTPVQLIGKMFGVSHALVVQIVHRKSWKHVL